MWMKNMLARILIRFLACLPFTVLQGLAILASALVWHGNTRIRKVISTNIALCYPNLAKEKQQQLARQASREIVLTALEMPRTWLFVGGHDKTLPGPIQGLELIDNARKQGKGIILITPHLGNWEYLIIKMASLYPCSVLCNNADDIVAVSINDIVQNGRSKTGATMVQTRQGVKVLVETVKRNELVMIAPDQIPDNRNAYVFADFFTQAAPTMTLVSRLAKVTGATVLAAFAKRLSAGKYELVIRPVGDGIYSSDIQESTTVLNKTIEQLINEAPSQFLWTYKRFYRGPDGKRKIYKRHV